jgi:hypothetical protein
MQERYLGRLEPGMDVCDINGDKIGTISRVYRHQMASVETSGGVATAPPDEVLEIKTGLLGLGKHYYVPLSAVEDVTTGCVFVKQARDALDQHGWDARPAYLDEFS